MENTPTTPTAPDYGAIVKVVQTYVAAYNERDISKWKKAFHERARIFYTDAEGALYDSPISDLFEPTATRSSTDLVVCRIISVIQAGDGAVVTLGFDDSDGKGSSWVDIHPLLRIDGIWKITNKTATHNARAAWAGQGYVPSQGSS